MFKEKYGILSKASTTQVSLAESVLRLGGLFRKVSALSLSTASGLDTGAIAASSFYYVYAVISGGVVSLRASLSSQKPLGFVSYKKVGAFYTDTSGNVFKAYSFGDFNQISLSAKSDSAGVVSAEGSDFIDGNFSITSTSVYTATFITGIFSLPPNVIATAQNVANSTMIQEFTFITATTLVLYTSRADVGSLQASNFRVLCLKQGVDAIQPDWKDY